MFKSTYRSRPHRNPHAHGERLAPEQPFFSKTNQPVVQQKKQQSFFQAKLSIGQPNDKYEQEADAVANEVVNGNADGNMVQQKKISGIQRTSPPMEEERFGTNDAGMRKDKEIQEKPEVQRMCPGCEKEKEEMGGAVQTKAGGESTASPQLSSQIESVAGKGNALPKNTLQEMNTSFGVDFSNVNIHTGTQAMQMNKELGAQAFTHGSDIYFNSGKYNPESSGGKQLLAHELTHVVQQNTNIQRRAIQRQVIDRNVVTNDGIITSLGLTREEIIATITSADQDAIVLAQNAEDALTEQLEIVGNGDTVDPAVELVLNEELGLSFNNPAHHGLIRQQISRFRKVRETLQSGYLRYLSLGIGNVQLVGCSVGNCGPNFAFSCPGNRLIVLCQSFWDNPDQQSATVLHEPFHIWFHMASHAANALRRADATCFESFAIRVSGRSAFASCDTHTAG